MCKRRAHHDSVVARCQFNGADGVCSAVAVSSVAVSRMAIQQCNVELETLTVEKSYSEGLDGRL